VTYWIVSALLLGLFALTARNGEWISDTWIHSATISEVARHPWHPLEPLTGEAVSFPYFSPWAMLLGWFVRLTGLPVFTVLTLAGLASTAAFLAAWARLVRAFAEAPWAPLLCLLCLLLLWGAGHWYWSGFPSLATFSVGFTWPSVLAAAMWFELWRAALRLVELGRIPLVVAFLVLPGLIVLIHPFTAVVATVSVGLTLAVRWRTGGIRVLRVVLLAVVSGLLAFVWPWAGLRTLLANPAGFDAIHHQLYGWRMFVIRWVLVAVTIPALLVRLRRHRFDPLPWTAAACAAGVLVGGITHVWSLGRLGPGIAIPGCLALGVALADALNRRQRLAPSARWAYGGLAIATCIALLIGARANAWAMARAVPDAGMRARAERLTGSPAPYPRIAWIAASVHAGDVAVTNDWQVRRELPTYGVRTVELPWPSPAVTDGPARASAERILLRPATPEATRRRLLEAYHVSWLVWLPTPEARQWPGPGWQLVACGPRGAALLHAEGDDPAPPAPTCSR
jgi:hypothetical protein